jgi:hypothetical protein
MNNVGLGESRNGRTRNEKYDSIYDCSKYCGNGKNI